MQAAIHPSRLWTPPSGVLGTLVQEAEQRAAALEGSARALGQAAARAPVPPSFARALRGASVAVIAEVKRRSPSLGAIRPELSAESQAAAYTAGGAAALSILTEPHHFGGETEDLVAARSGSSLPLLKKDFHVHPAQLIEARARGASAVLLIARALPPARLLELATTAGDLGLEALVEVRDERELGDALAAGATIVGVNNRDLETLRIDPGTADRIVPLVPPGVIAVAESGVRSRSDVERYAAAGCDAVLVGSSLSASQDPAGALRMLTGVARVARVARGG